MKNTDSYSDIIRSLESFQSIEAPERIRQKVINHWITVDEKTKPSYTSFFAVRIAVIVLSLLVLGTAGVVVASENSKPGSILYPIKKKVEQIKVFVTQDKAKKTDLQLNNANNSLNEIKDSAKENKDTELNNATKEYERDVKGAIDTAKKSGSEDILNKTQNTLQTHTEKLEEVKTIVPTQAQQAIQNAINASEKGKEEVKSNNGTGNTNNSSNANSNAEIKENGNSQNDSHGKK